MLVASWNVNRKEQKKKVVMTHRKYAKKNSIKLSANVACYKKLLSKNFAKFFVFCNAKKNPNNEKSLSRIRQAVN